jgi:hypothetical protein
MHIERALCVELSRIVDIYEARDCFFAQAPPRRRFNFLCSDEACRESSGTKVTGVNYDKLVEESEQYVRPHFRENTKHITDCEWMELEQALTELEDEQGDEPAIGDEPGGPGRRRNVKTSNVVDIFVPATAVGAREGGRIPLDVRDRIRQIPDRRGRIDATKKYLKANPNKTGFLENVVDSYLGLTGDERRATRLKIGDARWRSYRECFRPIAFYDRRPASDYIFYGGARARKYGANYSLRFFDKVVHEGRERWVTIYVERERLNRYRHREYLLEFLEGMLEEDRYATVFFYGSFRPSAKREDYLDVVIDHFDNLVLRLK